MLDQGNRMEIGRRPRSAIVCSTEFAQRLVQRQTVVIARVNAANGAVPKCEDQCPLARRQCAVAPRGGVGQPLARLRHICIQVSLRTIAQYGHQVGRGEHLVGNRLANERRQPGRLLEPPRTVKTRQQD